MTENIWISNKISLKYVPWQFDSIGSDNGLAPPRRQAIIWANADPVHRCTYAAQGGDKLSQSCTFCSLIDNNELCLIDLFPTDIQMITHINVNINSICFNCTLNAKWFIEECVHVTRNILLDYKCYKVCLKCIFGWMQVGTVLWLQMSDCDLHFPKYINWLVNWKRD